jgi:CRISPR-associated endonuclease/helicase Cas3
VARSVLKDHDDPLSLEAVRAYFARLYWQRGEDELDALKIGAKRGVMRALCDSHALCRKLCRLDYPFADIGAAFRLIEETMVPVIIPASGAAPRNAPDDLIKALQFSDGAGGVGGIARRLQPYLVQVPRPARTALQKADLVGAIRPDRFGDQFLMLTDPARYSPQRGLDWRMPELRDIEGDIL